jgi:hypothetical protein
MTIINNIEGATRRIYLHADTVGQDVHPMDIYTEMRTMRKNDENLRKFDVFLRGFGNINKGGGKSTERYVRCEQGTRIVPYDTTHELTVTGTIITDDGQEGIACFDKYPLTVTTSVDINYVPPQVEIIRVSGGAGISASSIRELVAAVWAEPAKDVNIATINNAPILGRGVNADKWRGDE